MRLKKGFPWTLSTSIFLIFLSTFLFLLTFFHTNEELTQRFTTPCREINCSSQFFLNEQKIIETRLNQTDDSNSVYSEILLTYDSSSPNNQHAIAHIFGEALYRIKGLSGITACDNSFAFGCFHGFLTNAIAKEGVRIINNLDNMCIQKYGEYDLGCQHGIGHGIAEYYGSSNLNQSLDSCAKLSWKYPLMGCADGVFMEYIMPSMGPDNPGSVQIKPINILKPFDPCNKVQRFQAGCFYNLGIYYFHAFHSESKSALDLCNTAPGSFNKKACILGVGNSIYSNLRDIPKTISECQKANDNDVRLLCRAGAAWILYANTQTRKEVTKFCQNLNQKEEIICREETNILRHILKN